jgi:hypothetical protein
MQHDLALSYGQIGLLLGVPVLVAAVLEPLLGLAGDTRRRRALIGAVAGPLLVAVSVRLGPGWRPAFVVVGLAGLGGLAYTGLRSLNEP